MNLLDHLGNRLAGKGQTILYALAGLVGAVILFFVYSWWSDNRADDARLALGKAIEITDAPVVTGTPDPNEKGPTFPSERERAQKAVEEFQKVQQKYGSPYSDLARFFAATNLLIVEREKGIGELEQISKNGNSEVAARAKFALAQTREADGQLDAAVALYQELQKEQGKYIPDNTLNLRLASIYEKQDKKEAAVDILFRMVDEARKARQSKDDKGDKGDKIERPAPESAVVRAASEKLQKLSPERYAQLPPEPVPARGGGFPSF